MSSTRSTTRPWFMFAIILLGAPALAGCTSPEEDDNGATSPPPPTPPPTPPAPPSPPAPRGDGLTTTEIAALVVAFNDEPLTGGQEFDAHLTKWVNEDTFLLLHFDNDEPARAEKLLWMGFGVKGVFCAESQPGPEFTHFHQYSAPTYAEGHGGQAGDEGYWLLHVAVADFESPFGHATAGVDHAFGPTPPPACGAEAAEPSFEPSGAGPLSTTEIAALAAALDSEPLRGGQEFEAHLTKWVNEGTFLLQHYDNDDPLMAETLLWTGIGVRGTFCADSQPSDDFTHFHSAYAETYAAGHGGQPGQQGYWLLHAAVAEFDSPFGPTHHGVDSAFGPTPPPEC